MRLHEETGSQTEADPLTDPLAGWLAAQTLRLNAGRARRMTLLVAGALAFGLALALAAFRAGRFVRDAALVEVGAWCGVGLAELRRAAAVAGARDRRFSTAGRDAA